MSANCLIGSVRANIWGNILGKCPDILTSSYLSLSRPPVSSSLKFSATAPLPTLHKLFGTDSQKGKTSVNFTYPPLALSSATFGSRLKIEFSKLSYPESSRHVRHHHRLQP